ncbi:MAG TPA: CHAT domain-containing protein [Pyrinomonadaceae bacterium]|nr:CHAT domain-containing protein [Pyrinomonadaceae bacterium]
MEVRLLTEPDFREKLDLAIEEIIDRYVAGEFEGAELERVRSHFLKSDDRQRKLRFAMALKEQKRRRTSRKGSQPRRFTSHLAVAASILAIIGIGFIAFQALRPQSDLKDGLIALQAAYPAERPVEGRLSDFNYVPLPNQRGASARVDYNQREIAATLLLKTVRDNPTAASHHAAAKYYLMNHQFAEAQKEFAAALELDPQNAKIHNDFGAALLEEGLLQSSAADNSKQLELYGRSLEHINKALDLDNSLLEALFNRALVYQTMRPSEQAKQAWQEYLKKDSSSTSKWAEEARRNLRLLEQQLGSSPKQDDKFKEFLEALDKSDHNAARQTLSTAYTSAGNAITNQLLDFFVGVEPFREALDPPSTLAALTYVAKLESDTSGDQYTSSLLAQYSHTSLTSKATLAKARYHLRTGYSLFERSSFAEAALEYDKAKTNYELANDMAGQVFAEYRLAHCYVLLSKTEQARLAFKRLLLVCEANRYQWLAAQCLFGLAHVNFNSSEFSKALDYSSQALTKFELIDDVNGTLKCLTQLADINQALNQVSTALGYLSRTLRVGDDASVEPKQRWGILNQIGFSMTSLKLPAAALFYQKEALKLAIEMSIPLLLSRSYGYVGSAYAALKMYPEAVNEATRAYEIGRSMAGDRTGLEITALALQQLGDIYRAAGSCDRAIEHYDQSLVLFENLSFDYYAYVAHKGKLQCFIAASNKSVMRDELQTVLGLSELYRSKITEDSQRNSFFDEEQGVYDLAVAYEFAEETNYVKALGYSEQSRARSLLDAVQRGTATRAPKPEAGSPVVTRSLTVAEIQARMPSNSQIVQYAVLDNRVIIWVVTQTEVRQKSVPIQLSELSEKVNAFLETINQWPLDEAYKRDRGSELYDLLIRPIKDYLDKFRVLVIVPDKILNYLPFAALTSSDTSHYLIEEYELGVAPSSTLFANLSAVARRKSTIRDERLLSVGDPKFDAKAFKSLQSLPSSAEEARAVAGLYPNNHELLLRERARESTIKRKLESVDVAHFAMHFIVNERSEMLSGFPLTPETLNNASNESSNGFLESQEIYRLDLHRLRLAILSACQTGIERQYRGEGAVGAARPFFVAGVPTVVASLWPVDSDASAELMIEFHQHLHRPMRVSQALREAQVDMIRGANARFRNPYYWAPFLTIGGLSN